MNQRTASHLARSIVLFLSMAGMLLGTSGAAWATPRRDLLGQTAPTASITGAVYFRPRYHIMQQTPRPYLVILDVTRSMSWNFAGQGTRHGQTVQCGPTSDPNVQRQHCGANAPWHTLSERRIYMVKQALLSFVDQLNPNDTMRLIAFSTRKVRANDAWTLADEAGKRRFKRAVLDAGKYHDRRYRTAGHAPTASALYLARQLVAEMPQIAPNGALYGSPVVILLTDSVANSFLLDGGGWRYYDDACGGAPFSEDRAECHVGYVPNTNPPVPMPITAMGEQAQLLKQNATIYVIALADLDATGLRNVASDTEYPFYSETPDGAGLPDILAGIASSSAQDLCVPAGGDQWVNTIAPDRVGQVPPPHGPLVYPTVGYAYLSDQHDNPLPGSRDRAPITVDAQTGRMSYRFDDLAAGVYLMRAFVAHRHNDDISRIYSLLFNPETQTSDEIFTFILQPPGSPGQVVMMDPLYQELNGSVCPLP